MTEESLTAFENAKILLSPDIYHPKQLEDRIYHINLCRKLHRNNMFTKLISYNYFRTAQFPSQKGKKIIKMFLFCTIRIFFNLQKTKQI